MKKARNFNQSRPRKNRRTRDGARLLRLWREKKLKEKRGEGSKESRDGVTRSRLGGAKSPVSSPEESRIETLDNAGKGTWDALNENGRS